MRLLLGLILVLIALNFLRNASNRYIFRFLLVLTKNQRLATIIFSFLFLPGVGLHECSHWLMAKLLLVKTQRFSLLPEWTEDGTIRFGFVETSRTDRIRTAVIAAAPLISGISVVTWLAFTYLHLDLTLTGLIHLDTAIIQDGLQVFFGTPDVFLWMYLLFTICNTMLPSPSDYKAWLPIALIFTLVYILIILISMGSSTGTWLVNTANSIAVILLKAFGIALFLNFCLIVPLWLIGKLLKVGKGSIYV